MLRTSNPVLSSKSFGGFAAQAPSPTHTQGVREEAMTIPGTVNKTAILLAAVVAAALWPWHLMQTDPTAALTWLWVGMVGGFVTALIIIFKKEWAGPLSPVYAVCEGLALGALSAFFERAYPGIVFQAVGLTMGTLAAMLIIYRTGAIKATDNFKRGVIAATGAIALVYLATFVMRMFGMPVSFMHSSGPLGIGISMVVVVVAALNLVLDFDLIEKGAARGAPKYMEWYGAFGLLVTLVWLYLEILRLLGRLNRR
ncbi:MAG TPA: Bax inhibitor-1/YccA family protein [Polyangia bacterium]|nr:Bax inhibitor-1/YccA family protein [Polyangia bacterium]